MNKNKNKVESHLLRHLLQPITEVNLLGDIFPRIQYLTDDVSC